MEYMTIQEAAEFWEISPRRIQTLCAEGRLKGAIKFGRQWAIPTTTEKPDDARIKSGKYIKSAAPNMTVAADTAKTEIQADEKPKYNANKG